MDTIFTAKTLIMIIAVLTGIITVYIAYRVGIKRGRKKANIAIDKEALERWLGVGDEKIPLELYNLVANIRVSGSRDYHSLTNVYLAACSITVAAVGLTLKNASAASCLVAGIFSLLGLFICLQMAVAQARFRAENYYWERVLRRAEAESEWEKPKLFTSLHAFREEAGIAGVTGAAQGMTANFGVRFHRAWWGARMKALPFVFAIVFTLTLAISIVLGIKTQQSANKSLSSDCQTRSAYLLTG